jgi:hypothetical protein
MQFFFTKNDDRVFQKKKIPKRSAQTRAFQRTRIRAVWGTIGRGKYLNGDFFPFFSVFGLFLLKNFFNMGQIFEFFS